MREMNSQGRLFSPIYIRKAVCETPRPLKIIAELTTQVSSAIYHAESRNADEKPFEPLSHSSGLAEDQQDFKIGIGDSAGNSQPTKISFGQMHAP